MNTLNTVIGCMSDYDPEALAVEQARHIIRECVVPVNGVQYVAVRTALDRVLANDLISPINVPANDNSAMDGYAFDSSALGGGSPRLEVVGTALAGRPYIGTVTAGQCVRIMTGALMPSGCDTVIPQELVDADDTYVRFAPDAVRAGQHRRRAGEDLAAGKPALRAGKWLRPADLGLIASLGIVEVPVFRRVRVAFFSTGDELRSAGQMLDPGCVYDSNRYTLFGMLHRLGADVLDLGVVRDDPVALEAAFRHACENADIVITSGGVSVGDADFTKPMMARLGEVAFWKVAMRPGRPLAFGRLASAGHDALLFGLPGNPVAVMATFYLFVRDALLATMGANSQALPLMRARSAGAIAKRPGRTEFLRGIVSSGSAGPVEVSVTGAQGSGMLHSMSEANCFVVLPHAQGNVAAGDEVDILLFEGLI
ncbi:gephyrin-like molybdotransferase Glp [Pandoraea sp.]|uniref:molybdopterin molybdotransferase MoeA n=1 Tax=Pandoraea sp. TaxID=1883445 RepID=UPI00120A77BB|nr:gephyrin-like molybdotransferase Glp [Pandoraea sp.]MDE2287656.1 molybdopterin molybdotransferase MoeA [Burkholderiales bacterium]MDE2609153.1 molybdopterin molybdotransferase MoeA [Burkholderiales bacterium]TAL54055.1 MAG: molybdopterin molybdenumtransferase MoeA [Pandoraea sp.]TAM14167.1 MAG: molybdopterin molybdenumtransferase MoeA [Pandoraea sp.]